MAAETYYLLISLIGSIGTAFWLVNLLYGRFKATTLIGLRFKLGSPEHKSYINLGRTRNLLITGAMLLFFLANTVNSVLRLIRLDTPDANVLLWASPFIAIGLIALMFYAGRREAKKYRRQ